MGTFSNTSVLRLIPMIIDGSPQLPTHLALAQEYP
jgi:hypothetical protein